MSGECVVRYRPEDRCPVRLFCFPHAGGGASAFAWWARAGSPGVDLCGIRAPGRESRIAETPPVRFAGLLDGLETAVAPYTDVPFAFYGQCAGGVVAFELARRLRRRGAPLPLALFVSDAAAPERAGGEVAERLADLPTDGLIAALRESGGTPPAFLDRPDLFELVEDAIRADLRVLADYRHEPADPLPVPISALALRGQDRPSPDEVAGWGRHTSAAFTLRLVDGESFAGTVEREALRSAITADLERLASAPAA